MSKSKWICTYKARADGRKVQIAFSSKGEAESFKAMLSRVDPNSDPYVEEDT